MQLTRNFHRSEFRCLCKDRGFAVDDTWCGGEVWVHRELVVMLQALRDYFGRPIDISSGCRCPRYNGEGLVAQEYPRGAERSQHKRGTGADIVVRGVGTDEVAKTAERLGFYVIEYPERGFVHVDIRNYI